MKTNEHDETDIAVSNTIRTLLQTIHELCDHIAREANINEVPPLCFQKGFALLQHFKSVYDTVEAVNKAKGPKS